MRFENIVVTGGSGLLGRFVVDELLDRARITVVDLTPPAAGVAPRVAFHRTNILDVEGLAGALAGAEAVIHLAGIDDGNPFPDHDYFRTNVVGAWNVMHAAEAAGVRHLVVASSSSTYGLGADRMPDYLPIDEGHPLTTRATYGHTKEQIESTARHLVRRGNLSVVCLRPTLIVRPEREAAILAQLRLDDPHADRPDHLPPPAGEPPYGALSPLRMYVRSRDAARCFRLALEYTEERYDVFNVAANDGIGRPETLAHLERFYGRPPPVRDPDRYRSDPHASVVDASRAAGRLGWSAAGDWRDVIEEHADEQT